jgi:hypothetical protein
MQTAYRINTKNKLFLGLGVERLMIAQTNFAYKLGEKETINTVNDNWGIAEGLNPWDLRFSAGICHKISPRFNIEIIAACGLFDRTSGSVINKYERNSELSVQVGLKYDLFKRF